MTDPGLPPKHRSLNLLESLVKEEEEKAAERSRSARSIDIPYDNNVTNSAEFYDTDKQQLTRENSFTSTNFTEYKMKDQDIGSQVKRGDPNAGFKGKKVKKQRSRSDTSDKSSKKDRPFSADYNKFSRHEGNSKSPGRPSTAKNRNSRTSSPKGSRPRSGRSYSSESSSSDSDDTLKKHNSDFDDFFDSPKGSDNERKESRRNSKDKEVKKRRGSSNESESRSRSGERNKRESRSRRRSVSSSHSSSYSSDEDREKNYTNGHGKNNENRGAKHNKIKTIPLDDYFSLSPSEDEAPKSLPPKPAKQTKRLLTRKKKQNCSTIVQINPDQYLKGKLHQKYSELEELLNCSFVDQKSHVTRHHLYQMELLRDQYQNASHGHMSSATIIPRSLPEDVRRKQTRPYSAGPRRPNSAKRTMQTRWRGSDQNIATNDEKAYKTLRSVMIAEHARKKEKIRTDINADRPTSAKKHPKKLKKLNASLTSKTSDSEEETSERPSQASSKLTSKATDTSLNTTNTTPRSKNTNHGIDHHIKNSENKKLKKWLKEKDKLYRQKIKEERKKKREEREQLILEANKKIENRMKSQKMVKEWMKEKNKELAQKCKEERKREKEILENAKKELDLTDAMKIRPQSAPMQRSVDVDVDKANIRGGDTPGYVKDQIHMKRDIEEENRQAKQAQTPHPPQTKFIYKRPVAGKIKLKMQIRGKSPVALKTDAETNGEKSEDESKIKMRISYDDWVKKKREDDAEKKKQANAQRQKELAKSDPELERIIPALGKKRIEDKLNSRKRIDTGIKKFDNKVNNSFGGGEFDVERKPFTDRPKSAYRLEGDRDSSGPALTISSKQLQRPSTAPARGRAAPSPKKSAMSPRKAVIPTPADKVMSNNDVSNPYQLPFPPDKGVPIHVADRQRKIFADIVTSNLNEIEQRALLNAELIREGVSDEDIERHRQQMEADFAKYRGTHQTESTEVNESEDEEEEVDPRPKITDIMYSPRKREDTSESSSDEHSSDKKNSDDQSETPRSPEEKSDSKYYFDLGPPVIDKEGDKSDKITDESKADDVNTGEKKLPETDPDLGKTDDDKVNENGNSDVNNHSHYKTYENLNELKIEAKVNESGRENETENSDLDNDREVLRPNILDLQYEDDFQDDYYVDEEEDEQDKSVETKSVTIVSDPDPNVVGILKERDDKFPEPESCEEPSFREKIEKETRLTASNEDLTGSRKRVSFNEKTEVFQSFESTSTDTVTPHNEFDPKAESLDAQSDLHDSYLDRSTSSELSGLFHSENLEESKDLGFDGESESREGAFITNPDES